MQTAISFFVRLEARPLVAGTIRFADLDRAFDADEFLGDRLFFDTGRLNEEDKG